MSIGLDRIRERKFRGPETAWATTSPCGLLVEAERGSNHHARARFSEPSSYRIQIN